MMNEYDATDDIRTDLRQPAVPLTTETPLVIHVAGKSRAIVINELRGEVRYEQRCTRCGVLLSTEILGYLPESLIAVDTHFQAMYLGDLAPNCMPVVPPYEVRKALREATLKVGRP